MRNEEYEIPWKIFDVEVSTGRSAAEGESEGGRSKNRLFSRGENHRRGIREARRRFGFPTLFQGW